MDNYTPINCSFFDIIEHYAVRKEIALIRFFSEEAIEVAQVGQILDTKIKNKEEFIIVSFQDNPIRMDRLIAIDDNLLSQFRDCTIHKNLPLS